jgi:hypothetical protein
MSICSTESFILGGLSSVGLLFSYLNSMVVAVMAAPRFVLFFFCRELSFFECSRQPLDPPASATSARLCISASGALADYKRDVLYGLARYGYGLLFAQYRWWRLLARI